ncbi:MAG: glycoside hydrolase family 10 protein [Fimbriimonas sp.]
MRYAAALLALTCLVTLFAFAGRPDAKVRSPRAASLSVPPPLQREFRGVWVATVANIDWPSKPGLSSAQQQAELVKIFDTAASLNLNAIVFQVRPSADALYESRFEPWSEYLTGRQGRAPSPMWDPLAFAVQEAHKRGLELHCWFNPYRALHPAQKGPVADRHFVRTNPKVVKTYGKFLWMDPGEPEVQQRSLDVMLDVVKRYDVDGIHIDDYFYPYKEKDSAGNEIPFPDQASWQRYVASGGKMKRDDWRRHNVDTFIEKLYKEIKKERAWVKFGISPFGIYRPGYPESIKAGVDQYADLYADALKWYREGWVDYYTPQLYWPIKQTAQSYPVLLDWWMDQNVKGRHLWPGNFTSKVNPSDGNWPAQELTDQISITRKRGAGGNVHFSMKAFSSNYGGISDELRGGVYAGKALVPASPWLDNKKPNAPKLEAKQDGDRTWSVNWSPNQDEDIRFFVITPQVAGKWMKPTITSAREMTIRSDAGAPPQLIAVSAIDRVGNESAVSVVALK